eukprot:357951-Chlamydomonas_euryale.AAC.3
MQAHIRCVTHCQVHLSLEKVARSLLQKTCASAANLGCDETSFQEIGRQHRTRLVAASMPCAVGSPSKFRSFDATPLAPLRPQ